jgi:hypothetical protein
VVGSAATGKMSCFPPLLVHHQTPFPLAREAFRLCSFTPSFAEPSCDRGGT